MPTTDEERKLQAEVNRGNEARMILTHDLVTSAFSAMDAHYSAVIRRSKPADREAREDAYLMLRAIDEFRGLLTRTIETGTMAAATLVLRHEQERDAEASGL